MIGRSFILVFLHSIFKQCVNIVIQHALTSIIERKIVLTSDVCSRPPITIKSHNLHASDIRKAIGETTSYHEWDSFPFFSS